MIHHRKFHRQFTWDNFCDAVETFWNMQSSNLICHRNNCITYCDSNLFDMHKFGQTSHRPSTKLATKFNNKILSLSHYELPIESFLRGTNFKWASCMASCMNRQLIIIQTIWAWKFIGKSDRVNIGLSIYCWQIVDHRLHRVDSY